MESEQRFSSRKEIPFKKLPFEPKLDPLLKTLWSDVTMPKGWISANSITMTLKNVLICKCNLERVWQYYH